MSAETTREVISVRVTRPAIDRVEASAERLVASIGPDRVTPNHMKRAVVTSGLCPEEAAPFLREAPARPEPPIEDGELSARPEGAQNVS